MPKGCADPSAVGINTVGNITFPLTDYKLPSISTWKQQQGNFNQSLKNEILKETS